ncbi:hypothetical protein DASC09_029960 [Saccharomycopsis crataegensis]|uniref:Autophagy-related protein 10 n=1 Tax=Saccharomycopsis crataegensis TaxID=43959 RepID=A0AAV5QM79_9ASCO|nr:hypothetical protein DASC09_029960 [Saccharomycopsis crataegensis]
MISEGRYNEEIEKLYVVLKQSSSNDSVEDSWGKLHTLELLTRDTMKYCLIRKGFENKDGDKCYASEVTISYSRSYCEPIMHFRFYDTSLPDTPINEIESVLEKKLLNTEEFTGFQRSSQHPRHVINPDIHGLADPEVSDIDDVLEGNDEVPQNNTMDHIFIYLTLDYHTVLDHSIWFFLHPCATRDIVPKNSQNYLIAWFTVYGKLIDFKVDQSEIKKVLTI